MDLLPFFTSPFLSDEQKEHAQQIKALLKKIFSNQLDNLPVVKWKECQQTPDYFCIYLLCKNDKVGPFFQSVLKRWLLPEKEVDIVFFQQMAFQLPGVQEGQFFVAEAKVLIEDGRDLTFIKNHISLLAKEIASGIKSPTYAKTLLETKVSSYDQKITLAHERLIQILKRYGRNFDEEIFNEINGLAILTSRSFREQRPFEHLTRLACSTYLIRKNLRRSSTAFPEMRHLKLKMVQTYLKFPFGTKSVLGFIIGVYLLDKHEFFEERHILQAVQKFFPDVSVVKGSFFTYQSPDEMLRTLYLEIEKKDGTRFSLIEIKLLKKSLEEELKGRIQKLIPSVFMIRNEEEIMKNILRLSRELKYVYDFPQMMITFEEQTDHELSFIVTLVHVKKNEILPQLKKIGAQIERQQVVGYLRKKYPKEAYVLRLNIAKTAALLRADFSVNLHRARQKVVSLLTEAFGEMRDYNGGMILKQEELFSEFKEELSDKNEDLLETFFHSLSPIEMQAMLPLTCLKTLFQMVQEAIKIPLTKKENYYLKFSESEEQIFAVIRVSDPTFKEHLEKQLPSQKSLAFTKVEFQGTSIWGYIYECREENKRKAFILAIKKSLSEWLQQMEKMQVLRFSFEDLPFPLDPRLVGDEHAQIVFKLLFEGLMRLAADGKPTFAIAQEVQISEDKKRYAFQLRNCSWSDGSSVVAYDFEYAWKKILSPEFNTFFAYLLYPIKNAKAAKEGLLPLDQVGIKSIHDQLLVVDLEYPSPSFLDSLALSFFSPVNHRVDQLHPNWVTQEGERYICNGPFQLKKNHPAQGYELIKNPLYWDERVVQLDKILISKSDAYTAFEMFKNDEIDILGRPMRAWEDFFHDSSEEICVFSSFNSIFYSFNVQRFPFHHAKLRKAFALALNRKEMIQELAYPGDPAFTPLPKAHSQLKTNPFLDGDVKNARILFAEALDELQLQKSEFPLVTFYYTQGGIRDKLAQAVKKQLEDALGIQCKTESYDWKSHFSKMIQGDFQICAVLWISWMNDPFYTLNAFKSATDKINFSKWEHPDYKQLLDAANQEIQIEKRNAYLAQAEEMLLQEMPIIPLFHEHRQAIKKRHLHLPSGVGMQTGIVDFTSAFIRKER